MPVAYPHIAERLFGHAHAIEPTALRAIIEGPVGRRVLAGERIEIDKDGRKAAKARRGRALAMVEAEQIRGRDGMSEYVLTNDGVAILSIAGALSKRFDWLAAACGFATYEALGASLNAALADFRVKAILFDVDSPGGQVDGMLDLADQILAARSKMPVWAVANSVAASAAYALAGSAEKLYLPRLAQVGSIGAVMMHIDQSAQDQARGLKYSAIFSGSRKIDGWDHASLSSEARAAMQGRVDHCRQALADLVGRQGRISAKDALGTEAAVYSDTDAVKAGLADGIQTFDATLAALTQQISKNSSTQISASAANQGASAMTTQKDQLLSGASPTALVAGQTAGASGDTAAAAAETAAAAVTESATSAAKPAAGEKCQTCGQMMPDDNDGDEPDPNSAASSSAAAAAAGYTVEMAMETMELCAIAKRPVAEAKAFVASKTPIAGVRSALAAKAAAEADALAVDATARPAGTAEQDVAAAWDQVVTEQNAKLPQNTKR
jgi:ClpP class serine protease